MPFNGQEPWNKGLKVTAVCPQGHEYTEENTGYSKDNRPGTPAEGYPYCRICHAERAAAQRAAQTAEEVARRKAQNRATAKRRNQRYRAEAIAAYGSACVCCNEQTPEFLHLDHVHNDGADHRKQIGQGGMKILEWAKKNNWPDTLQLKCHNCGMAEGYYGYCPHESNRGS